MPAEHVVSIGRPFVGDTWDVECTCGFEVKDLSSSEAAEDTARWHRGEPSTLGRDCRGGPPMTTNPDVDQVVRWRVTECYGGWNVHGFDPDHALVFECLHLHPYRANGVACGKRLLPEAKGPTR